MIVQLKRDSFARETMVREHAPQRMLIESYTCDNCGARNVHQGLWRYGTERDSINGRTIWHKGLFCSKRCHDSFYS